MAAFLDYGTNFHYLADGLHDDYDYYQEENYSHPAEQIPHHKSRRTLTVARWPVNSTFYEVRNSVCVVGFHRESVQFIKNKVGELLENPIPLEGFHVKKASDIKDGAFLVPKIILVGAHCPGRKLLDEESDEGQLDFLYDEACEVGADILVVYTGLPRTLYPPMRHIVYHPKVTDMLFPTQPILRELATQSCFITVTERTDLTSMQRSLIREWITRPVGTDHPVYKTADYLSSVDMSMSEAEVDRPRPPGIYAAEFTYENETQYQFATEEHPLAEKGKKRKKKKRAKEKSSRPGFPFRKKKGETNLIVLTEAREDVESSMEMDLYKSTEMVIESQGTIM